MEIHGFVTPRYLDQKWCRSFTVTNQKKKESDIPVKVVFDEDAYVASFLNNEKPTYAELEMKVYELEMALGPCTHYGPEVEPDCPVHGDT